MRQIAFFELTARRGDPGEHTVFVNIDEKDDASPTTARYWCTGLAKENVEVLRDILESLYYRYSEAGVEFIEVDVSKYHDRNP